MQASLIVKIQNPIYSVHCLANALYLFLASLLSYSLVPCSKSLLHLGYGSFMTVSPVLPQGILPPQLFLLHQLLLPKLLGHQFHPPILVDLQGSNKPHSPLKSMVTIFILISTYICLVLILVVRDTGASFTLGRKYLQNFGMDGNIPAKN